MAAGVGRLADACQHARQLADAGVVEQELGVRDRAAAGLTLRDRQLRVGEGRHLREMRHTQHLVLTSQRGQRPPDGGARFSADTGVDLVEHEGGRRRREYDAKCKHRARELPAGGRPGQGPGRLARIGRQQEHDLVGAVLPRRRHVAGLHGDLEPGRGHREGPEIALHGGRERAGSRSARLREPLRRGGDCLGGRGQVALDAGSPGVPVLELGQPFRGLDSVPLHVRERRTVLAHQLAQAGAALLHVGQALRVGNDRLGRRPHLVVELGRFDLQRADAFRDRFERVTPGQRRDCGAERVLGRTLELGVRGFERGAVRFRVGEDLLLGCECRFFVGVVDGGGGDLVQLVAQQVDLPRARSVVAAERGQLGFDATPRLVRVGERGARAALAGSPAKRSSIARCSDGWSSDWWAC